MIGVLHRSFRRLRELARRKRGWKVPCRLPEVSYALGATEPADLEVAEDLLTSLGATSELVVAAPRALMNEAVAIVRSSAVAQVRIVLVPGTASRGTLVNHAIVNALGTHVVLLDEKADATTARRVSARALGHELIAETTSGGAVVVRVSQRGLARIGFLSPRETWRLSAYAIRGQRLLGRRAARIPRNFANSGATPAEGFMRFPPDGDPVDVPVGAEDLRKTVADWGDLLVYPTPLAGSSWDRPFDGTCVERRPIWPGERRAPALVSVVMTAFNSAETVECAVASIVAQTHRELELIIVDDCSSDSTFDVCSRLARADSRIRVLRSPTNSGTYWCKNWAITQARGDSLAFQDADDVSAPCRLELQLDALAHNPKWPACTTLFQRRDLACRVVWVGGVKDQTGRIPLMVRRPVLDRVGFFDSVRAAADDEFIERIGLATGHDVVTLSTVQYWARHSLGSLTQPAALRASLPDDASGPSPSRRAYMAAARKWHRRIRAGLESPYLPFPLTQRPFPAPPELDAAPTGLG